MTSQQDQDQHQGQPFLEDQDHGLSAIVTAAGGLATLAQDEPGNLAMLFSAVDPLDSLDDLAEAQRLTATQPEPIETMNVSNAPLTGVYSSSGFDMIGILSRVVNRPNPLIDIGPIDMSCSFLVTDARQLDCPIVYCSPNFETLTGYKSGEILGRNCRFLQAPDGQVTEGSRRQHTDNSAVYHLKSYLMQSKEHQASIINYRKGGQPFVNLVTVIPVPDENNAVSFFVGLQVDLVEQPNAILEKMKNGTYVVNYQQMNIPPYIPGNGITVDPVDDYFRELPSSAVIAPLARAEVMRMIACPTDNEQQIQQDWNRLLLDQSRDFIHVLSLKGFFLYCSRGCTSLLEYDSEELVGHSLSSICHPSDIVPVMRDIKDAAVADTDKVVSLLYRVRRKYSGYMWIECQGKLHVDSSKSRKCLILSGRERPVYRLPIKELSHANAIFTQSVGQRHPAEPLKTEFWSKMSMNGLFLRVTPPVMDVLGHKLQTLQGSSLFRFAGDAHIPDISRVLGLVAVGEIVNLAYTMRNHRGVYVKVLSTFYPGDVAFGVGKATFALVQTRLVGSDDAKQVSGDCPVVDHARSGNENLFAELETVRSTSWQYELHQLEQANARLRAQIEALEHVSDKKKKKSTALADDGPKKICGQCHRTDSPEWRRGPNGPKELCNACGLKYAKTLSRNSGECP